MRDLAAGSMPRPQEWWRPEPPAVSGGDRESGNSARLPHAGSPVPFWGLMAYLLILLLAPQTFIPVLAPLRVAVLAVATSIGAYLFDRFMNGPPAGRRTPAIWIAAGILAWAVITMPLSYWPGGSLALLRDEYVKTLTVFWLLSRVVNTRPRLERVVWGITLMALPVAATAVGHFSDASVAYGRILGYESSPLTKNPNDLALTLNLILPFSIALLLGARRAWLRALLLAVTLLYVAGVIVTFSRAGFLTLAATFVYYVGGLLRRGRWGWVLAALALAVATAAVLPRSYLDRLGTITDLEADPTGSAQRRSTDTWAAMRVVLARPLLGTGIGMDAVALNDVRGATWVPVHNVYLEYAVDLGLPGLVLFLLLLGVCLRDARLVQRQLAGRPSLCGLFRIAQGAEAALVAFAVAGMFHPVAYDFYFYLVAGIALSVRTVYQLEEGGSAPERTRAARVREERPDAAEWTSGALLGRPDGV